MPKYLGIRRSMGRDWLALTLAIGATGIGIGASVAIIGALRAATSPLVRSPTPVVVVRHVVPPQPAYLKLPGPLYAAARHSRTLDALGFAVERRLVFRGDRAEEWRGCEVSADLLRILGATTVLGRTLESADFTEQRAVVLLGHAKWRAAFGGDPGIVGRTLRFDDRSVDVVGVLAPETLLPVFRELVAPDFVFPNTTRAAVIDEGGVITPVALLRSNVTIGESQAEMDALASVLSGRHPEVPDGSRVQLVEIGSEMRGERRRSLFLLLTSPSLMASVAFINLAHLMLLRQRRRSRDLAIAAALGASGVDVLRPLMAEYVAVAVGTSTTALLSLHYLKQNSLLVDSGGERIVSAVAADLYALAGAIAVAGALLAAVWPLRETLAGAANPRAASERPRPITQRRWLGELLIASEVGLASLLVTVALITFPQPPSAYSGIPTEEILVVDARLSPTVYTPQRARRYWEGVADAAERHPGVVAAVMGTSILSETGWASLRGRHVGDAEGWIVPVSRNYFQVLDMPVIEGRTFNRLEEVADRQLVGVVNESAQQLLWPGRSPVGLFYQTPWFPSAHRIVGVVRDVHVRPDRGQGPVMYMPIPYSMAPPRNLIVRTPRGRPLVGTQLMASASRLDDWAVIRHVETLDRLLADRFAQLRTRGQLYRLFALVAVVTAGIGVVTVVDLSVRRRLRDYAVRLALGASPWRIGGSLLLDVLRPASAGILVALLALWTISAELESLSGRPLRGDPWVLVWPVVLLFVVSGLAVVPALRRIGQTPPGSILNGQ